MTEPIVWDDEACPLVDCGEPAGQHGPTTFDDRGPFQMISRRRMVCGAGHRWTVESDGG